MGNADLEIFQSHFPGRNGSSQSIFLRCDFNIAVD